MIRGLRRPGVLLFIPPLVYLASYAYLAAYHGHLNLLGTVVHEGGTLTLWETALYVSHFLGHIPVYVIAALLTLGVHRCYAGAEGGPVAVPAAGRLGVGLLILVAASAALSLLHFGVEDTVAYLLQRKQGVDHHVPGGSWNLHLGSTSLLFLLIPVYIYALRRFLGLPVTWRSGGLAWVAAGGLLVLATTAVVNGDLIRPFALAWGDPRYLAHSVRELATFPLTYFPLPLYFLIRQERAIPKRPAMRSDRRLAIAVGAMAVLFAAGLAYQAILPLRIGIGELAQQPDFARGGRLSIPYLLASHYFEHLVDSIFFTLLILWLAALTRRPDRADARRPANG